jgi:3-oxoacyl-[acyl-carrier-protein] synthase-3
MAGVYLSHLASSLGSITRSVEEAGADDRLLSAAAALREAGFESHHACAEGEDSYALAARAFAASGIDAGTVDAIIYSTCLPLNGNAAHAEAFAGSRDVKHLMQFPASRLQAEFGMHGAFVVGLNQQACTGVLGAWRLARSLLVAEPGIGNVLCITADRFPATAFYEQAYNLISDGAAACLVSREPRGLRLDSVHHITNGAMVDASDDETVGSFFNYTCRLVRETLERSNLAIDDIRWIVPQNTNRKAWEILGRLLGIRPEQAWFPSMARTGHVISADNVINLKALADSGTLSPGDRILTFMAGYGSNWQCALLEAA